MTETCALTLSACRIWFWQVRPRDHVVWFVPPTRSPVSWLVTAWLLLRPFRLDVA